MLGESGAWDILTTQDQADIIQMLPLTAANKSLLTKLDSTESGVARPKELNITNEIFYTDVAKFKSDLSEGSYGKKWQGEAEVAMRERAQGLFDEWKEDEAERWWGQKMDP